jgi:hypothetical protein
MGLSSGPAAPSKNTKLDTDAAFLISEWVIVAYQVKTRPIIHIKFQSIKGIMKTRFDELETQNKCLGVCLFCLISVQWIK